MGNDIQAYLMVGLPESELEFKDAPDYAGWVKSGYHAKYEEDWRILCGDHYYLHDDEELKDIKRVSCTLDWPDPERQTCVGFIVAQTPDWELKELDWLNTMEDMSSKGRLFKKLFGKWGKAILIPRGDI
jgi:hypothetical protein